MIDFEELESGAFYLIESIDCDSVPHRELVNLLYSGADILLLLSVGKMG